jgi:hypothetical protein
MLVVAMLVGVAIHVEVLHLVVMRYLKYVDVRLIAWWWLASGASRPVEPGLMNSYCSWLEFTDLNPS